MNVKAILLTENKQIEVDAGGDAQAHIPPWAGEVAAVKAAREDTRISTGAVGPGDTETILAVAAGDMEEVEGEGLEGELQGEGNLDLPSLTSGSSPSSSRLMPTFYPATGSKTKRSRHGKTTLIPTSSPSTAMKTISPGTHARGSVRAAVQAKTEKLLPWGTRSGSPLTWRNEKDESN